MRPWGLLDADELLRFGYVYIIIFRLKSDTASFCRASPVLQSIKVT